MKACKVDNNQKVIVKALLQVGAKVWDTTKVGNGFPDLLVSFQGKDYKMEIKNPNTSYGKKGFNKNQKRFVDAWKGSPVFLVSSVDDALKVIGVKV